MRFVSRNLVDVEEASPATAPEILLDDGEMTHLALWFLEAERMMQQAVKYFPQLRTKVIEPEGSPCNTTCSALAHKKTNLHTQRDQGVVKPLTVRRKIKHRWVFCRKVKYSSDLNRLEQKQKRARSKAI